MINSFSPLINSFLNAALTGVGGILAAYLLSKLSGLFLARLVGRFWAHFIGNILALGVIIWALIYILNTTGAFGAIVILGTTFTGALTLGSENIASDLVAGIKIVLTQPFKIGDMVSVADHNGEVSELTLMNTTLTNDSGDRIIVHNSDVVSGTIINFSTRPIRQIEVKISIPVSQDLESVVAAIKEGVRDFSPETSQGMSSPNVLCEGVNDKGRMDVLVHAAIPAQMDEENEKTRLMIATLRALKKNNINLVY